MTWTKREAVTNLVILGDSPDNKKKVGGLLIGCPFDRMYPDKMNYLIVQQDGEELVLSGSASLGRQLSDRDVGKFVKCEFNGWGKSANGKFKVIDVNVWEDEPNDAMKKWPRFAEFNAKPNGKPPIAKAIPVTPVADEFEDFPGANSDADDDLPF
jgi:hypothetical protein